MLSNNKKTLLISTFFISGISIGGAVSAEQAAVNTAQNAPQNYQFPAANALPHMPARQQADTAQPVASVAKPQARIAPPPYAIPRSPYTGQNRFERPMPPQYGQPNGRNAFRTESVPMMAPYRPVGALGYNGGPNGSSPNGANAFRPDSMPIQAPFPPGPGRAPGYGRPNGAGHYAAGPYGQRSNSGPFGNNPMDNFGFGPFSKNSNEAPWETWPFGGHDSLWNRREIPFKDQSPTDWFQPGDPKEGMAIMWDDMISAPDELGEMPGGWNVPSISVPNPVDLEDQLEKASKEMPDLIRVYN